MIPRHDLAPVTVIGLGLMGSALAGVLLDKGHPVTVWNRTVAKAEPLVARGATRAATVADAVSASDVLIVCVTDYPASYQILEPVADLLAGRQLVQLSTGTPEQARDALAWGASTWRYRSSSGRWCAARSPPGTAATGSPPRTRPSGDHLQPQHRHAAGARLGAHPGALRPGDRAGARRRGPRLPHGVDQ